jgi:hypothetical protein
MRLPSLYAMPPAPHAALLRRHADDIIAMLISFPFRADVIFSPFAIEPSQSYMLSHFWLPLRH